MRLLCSLFNCLAIRSEILIKAPVTNFTRFFSISTTQQKNLSGWGSKKAHRNVKIQSQFIQEMADPQIEEKLAPLRAAVKEQVS
jgi:hypothetical protein